MGIKRHPKDRGFGYKKAYDYDESIKKHKVYVANYDSNSENDLEYHDYIYDMMNALEDMECNLWDVEISNGNWRGQTGYMTSSDPEKIAHALLMHDGRCRTEVWMDGDGLTGVCYHHDAPTGSWFTIKINEDENFQLLYSELNKCHIISNRYGKINKKKDE